MASYRYERDIDPQDLAPRKEKQYTRRERWANWWDYNLKWVLLIGIAGGFLAYTLIGHYFLPPTRTITSGWWPLTICQRIPSQALQTQLAAFGQDLNGDGKTVVTLNTYTLDYTQSAEGETESDAYLTMAAQSSWPPMCRAP